MGEGRQLHCCVVHVAVFGIVLCFRKPRGKYFCVGLYFCKGVVGFPQISCCFLEIALDQGCPIWGPRSIFFWPALRSESESEHHSLNSILTHFEQGLCLNVLCNSDWLQFTAWPQFLHCFRWVKGVRYLLLVRSITLQLKL